MKHRLNLSKLRSGKITGVSLVLAVLGSILVILNRQPPKIASKIEGFCQQIIQPNAKIENTKVNQIQGKEGATRESIRQILGTPYCTLPKISLRSGAITEREAYSLEDDSYLIVAYEGNQYLGYGIEADSSTQLSWLFRWDRTSKNQAKEIAIRELWEIQAGETIAGYRIAGGLGDVSIEFKGSILAPMQGLVTGDFVLVSDNNLIKNPTDCVIFSSSQMPAYLLKSCGLSDRNLGRVQQGNPIGKTGGYLHLSLLNYRKTDTQAGQWIYVSPSSKFLERLLKAS
ncbi:MAG: hypothetical protein F6K32_20080 [Desertifilum sp. SIO1I2]|nr:hypothetical protein [Desertifilum sp. SIO1I2]